MCLSLLVSHAQRVLGMTLSTVTATVRGYPHHVARVTRPADPAPRDLMVPPVCALATLARHTVSNCANIYSFRHMHNALIVHRSTATVAPMTSGAAREVPGNMAGRYPASEVTQ